MQAASALVCETGERLAQQWHSGGHGPAPAPLMPGVGRGLCTTSYLSLRGGLKPTKQSHNTLIITEIDTAQMRLAMTESEFFKGLWPWKD